MPLTADDIGVSGDGIVAMTTHYNEGGLCLLTLRDGQMAGFNMHATETLHAAGSPEGTRLFVAVKGEYGRGVAQFTHFGELYDPALCCTRFGPLDNRDIAGLAWRGNCLYATEASDKGANCIGSSTRRNGRPASNRSSKLIWPASRNWARSPWIRTATRGSSRPKMSCTCGPAAGSGSRRSRCRRPPCPRPWPWTTWIACWWPTREPTATSSCSTRPASLSAPSAPKADSPPAPRPGSYRPAAIRQAFGPGAGCRQEPLCLQRRRRLAADRPLGVLCVGRNDLVEAELESRGPDRRRHGSSRSRGRNPRLQLRQSIQARLVAAAGQGVELLRDDAGEPRSRGQPVDRPASQPGRLVGQSWLATHSWQAVRLRSGRLGRRGLPLLHAICRERAAWRSGRGIDVCLDPLERHGGRSLQT